MASRLSKEHCTTNRLFNYAYFASSRQDPGEGLLEYDGSVPKNGIFVEKISRPSFSRCSPNNWKCPRLRVVES